jgi:hypothetical protein
MLVVSKRTNRDLFNPGKDRFKLLEETKAKMQSVRDMLPAGAWLEQAREGCQKMMRDAASQANGVTWQDVPTVKQWNTFFGRTGKANHHVHHAVEEWIQKDYLQIVDNLDEVPGWILKAEEHTFGPGRVVTGTLYGDLRTAVEAAAKALPGGAEKASEAARAIRQVYTNRGLDDLWTVTEQWLASKGVSILD